MSETADQVLNSRFTIFGRSVPDLASCDFSQDWRYGKRWPASYYRSYEFYETKGDAYDVKFPWELSRMFYLVPVLVHSLVGGVRVAHLGFVSELLKRWRESNPLGYSVNWYPMEASMRAINLVLMADLLGMLESVADSRESGELAARARMLVLAMILEHGEFVWRTREFSDVRGNHFTANLVALLLSAAKLREVDESYTAWIGYSCDWLDREITLQFHPDGGNFEKACGYHKLVLEQFLLAAVARDRIGRPFSQSSQERLAKAASFSGAITRPDGLAANFGDTDDAYGLPVAMGHPRCHSSAVALAQLYLGRNLGVGGDDGRAELLSLLFGRRGDEKLESVETGSPIFVRHFQQSGYVVVKNPSVGFFLMVDVGEVGMNDLGGHGHNDLLSFELCISGLPLVVDPGCSGYTADLRKRDFYRSTRAHNTICVAGHEIAPLLGPWRIGGDARPTVVRCTPLDSGAEIVAGHDGYRRLTPPIHVERQLKADAISQTLHIRDTVVGKASGFSSLFTVHPQWTVHQVSDNRCEFKCGTATVEMTAECSIRLERSLYSEGYGQECETWAARCGADGSGSVAIAFTWLH